MLVLHKVENSLTDPETTQRQNRDICIHSTSKDALTEPKKKLLKRQKSNDSPLDPRYCAIMDTHRF